MEKCKCRKECYSKREVKHKREYLVKKRSLDLAYYKCPYCYHYHLTSKENMSGYS